MNGLQLIDEKNRKIIGLLQDDPDLTQSELAKDLHISQSAVAIRLARLAKSGLFLRGSSLNYGILGLRMGRADVEAKDFERVLKWASACPLFVNASLGIGSKNLSLLFVAEDLQMFHFLVDEHLRRFDEVSGVDFSEIVKWIREFVIGLNLEFQTKETPPCGMLPYCPKCPANPDYDGKVWKDSKKVLTR